MRGKKCKEVTVSHGMEKKKMGSGKDVDEMLAEYEQGSNLTCGGRKESGLKSIWKEKAEKFECCSQIRRRPCANISYSK